VSEPTVKQLLHRDREIAGLLSDLGCRTVGDQIVRRGQLVGRFDSWTRRAALVADAHASTAIGRALDEIGWTVEHVAHREALRDHSFAADGVRH
jgi:uncharacterized protein YukE